MTFPGTSRLLLVVSSAAVVLPSLLPSVQAWGGAPRRWWDPHPPLRFYWGVGRDGGAAPCCRGGDAPAGLSAALFSGSLRTVRKAAANTELLFPGNLSPVPNSPPQEVGSHIRPILLLCLVFTIPCPDHWATSQSAVVLRSPDSPSPGRSSSAFHPPPVPLKRTPRLTLLGEKIGLFSPPIFLHLPL